MQHPWLVLVLMLGAFFLLKRWLCVVQKTERFAIFVNGQFEALVGPGLCVRVKGVGEEWLKLTIGDIGQLISPNSAQFSGFQVPVENAGDAPVGSTVTITKFGTKELVVAAFNQR